MQQRGNNGELNQDRIENPSQPGQTEIYMEFTQEELFRIHLTLKIFMVEEVNIHKPIRNI